ncbi:MAG: hypothetical protein M1829_006374 [Trizodia sp. TS-e1964]|nr:MAG: hypothetical protein M1829_006374 [Trizodia sp. TS-e1964]
MVPKSIFIVLPLIGFAAIASAQIGGMPQQDFAPGFPDFLFGSLPSPAARLVRRQDGSLVCPAGQHSCQAVNASNVCCANNQFCYANLQGVVRCCSVGSNCDDPCSSVYSSEYACKVSSSATCCARACPAPSGFQCASSLGGGCCSVGSACISGGKCSSTIDPSAANTLSALPTAGCSASQTRCPTSLGGGCCDSTLTCAAIGTALSCLPGTGTSGTLGTPTGMVFEVSGQDSGLSTGAKAGIGAGVAVLVLIPASLLICCLLARRRRLNSQPAGTLPVSDGRTPMSNTPSIRNTGTPGTTGQRDYFGPYTNGDSSAEGYLAPNRAAVPINPDGPMDIAAPVEIADSTVTSPGDVNSAGRTPDGAHARDHEKPGFRSELPG